MNSRVKKILYLVLIAALLFAAGRTQKSLDRDRNRLGLTQMATLNNAPPLLAFTTVALGGFRGLISNFLWIRANNLQLNDKFFEAAQLANWITDLEPHFSQVWIFQAWNMAYNISVKFKENAPGDYTDRWRWVKNGVELLRDEGLKYNPDDVLIYRELAWFYQHKMGQNLDDGNIFYKMQWAKEMTPFFGPHGTNFTALLDPQTPEQKTNVWILEHKYKIDPVFAKKVDEEWGPFDWRVPEAHAIYWGAKGLAMAKKHPDKVKADDLITLRRIIYQSLYQAFKHGRIIANPFNDTYTLGPDLGLISKVNEAYETNYLEETQPNQKAGILRAQRNFLRDAIYFLYENNRISDAAKWFKYLGKKFPDKPIIEEEPDSLPKNVTLDQYVFSTIQIDINETSQERVTSAIMGFLQRSYIELVLGSDDRYLGFQNMATKVYQLYTKKTSGKTHNDRVVLPALDIMKRTALNDLLNPKTGMPFAARVELRARLGMPPETNAPPAVISTNSIAPAENEAITNSAGK